MRKTLQELSDKYNVNKPALYARLKKLQELNQDKELSNKIGNVLYLTDTGLALLEKDLKENPISSKQKEAKTRRVKKQDNRVDTSLNKELIDSLRAEINLLESQLKEKDKTIERLLSVIESLNSNYSQSLAESHSLTSQQQTIQALELSQPEQTGQQRGKRKGFLYNLLYARRIFRGDF